MFAFSDYFKNNVVAFRGDKGVRWDLCAPGFPDEPVSIIVCLLIFKFVEKTSSYHFYDLGNQLSSAGVFFGQTKYVSRIKTIQMLARSIINALFELVMNAAAQNRNLNIRKPFKTQFSQITQSNIPDNLNT